MKRILLCTFILLFCLTAGCTPPPQDDASASDGVIASKQANIPFTGSQYYAAAYLGYQQMTDLDFYTEQYLDSDKIPIHYLSSGDYYLVIPRYPGMTLRLYQRDIETDGRTLFFEDPDCRPFILQCNASDIFADAVICLSYDGESVEFSPFISLKDGSVELGPQGLELTKEGA